MANQEPVQCRTQHGSVNEITNHHQQVIQRQQQRLAQFDHYSLLCRIECSSQAVLHMRAILHIRAVLPTTNSVLSDPKLIGQQNDWLVRLLNVTAGSRYGDDLFMKLDIHIETLRKPTRSLPMMARETSKPKHEGFR